MIRTSKLFLVLHLHFEDNSQWYSSKWQLQNLL